METKIEDVLHEKDGQVKKHLIVTIYASDLKKSAFDLLFTQITTGPTDLKVLKRLAKEPLTTISIELEGKEE